MAIKQEQDAWFKLLYSSFGKDQYKVTETALSGRLEVASILGPDSNRYVLKTGQKLDHTQIKLLRFATERNWQKGCKLPKLAREGTDSHNSNVQWVLMQQVPGQSIEQLLQNPNNAQMCIDATWQAALGYQELLEAFMLEYPQYCNEGMDWIHDRLGTQGIKSWSFPIVQAGLVASNTIEEINTAWAHMATKYQEQFFIPVHGNIHGNHMFKDGRDSYIVDPQCWWRPFPGDTDKKIRGALYDWMRALDWMILRCPYPQTMMEIVLRNIFRKTRKYGIADSEIKTFLAMRGIGCLGADILKGMDTLERDAHLKERRLCLIKLIEGQF